MEVREAWQGTAQQLQQREAAQVQQVGQAVQQLREDLQQQLPSGKLKAIEGKLAALEGSVLSAGALPKLLPYMLPPVRAHMLCVHGTICSRAGSQGQLVRLLLIPAAAPVIIPGTVCYQSTASPHGSLLFRVCYSIEAQLMVLPTGRSAQSAARTLDAAGSQMADAAAARMDKIGQELLKDMQQGLQSSASVPLQQLSRLDAQLEVPSCPSGHGDDSHSTYGCKGLEAKKNCLSASCPGDGLLPCRFVKHSSQILVTGYR